MNREQANSILEAYINMERVGGDSKARQSLREVILDAMTEYRTQTVSTYPNITLPVDNTPKATWTGHDPLSPSYVTCTGYDTIHGTCATGVVDE